MKEIKAMIRPGRLAKLRAAVSGLVGFPGMSVSEVDGCSGYEPDLDHRSVREQLTDWSGKVRIEILCADEQVRELVTLIAEAAYTGHTGDGIIWVTEVQGRVRIVHKDSDLPLLP
jgi:nitrogen regulatory protein P-II 1